MNKIRLSSSCHYEEPCLPKAGEATKQSQKRDCFAPAGLAMTAGAGFTLIEVMLSVLILGIGLVIIVNSYLSALRGINAAGNNIQAMLLAREKFDELEISSLNKKGLSAFAASEVINQSGKNYNYSLNITEITEPEYIAKYLVQACLKFSWPEQNATKNATLSTYFPKYKEETENKSL